MPLLPDDYYMQEAILLGAKGRMTAPPNPWVGCLLVNESKVIGEGYSQPAGGNHAEVMALKAARQDPAGATAYVTLEPCAHTGRTPPCAEALIRAKIGRVVIALEDPDSRVSGQGMQMLRDAGIPVTLGCCAEMARLSLAPYLHHRTHQRPYSVLKVALSIDGKNAAADGTSQWISSKEARIDAQRLRAESQAILVGSGTALADNPRLTVRESTLLPLKQPLRVILDSSGRLPSSLNVFCADEAESLIVTTTRCPSERLREWEKCGTEVAVLSDDQETGRIDVNELFALLGQRGIIQVLVEGGGAVQGSLIKAGLCDSLIVYVGSCILGEQGHSAFKGMSITTLTEAPQLQLSEVAKVGNSARLSYNKQF